VDDGALATNAAPRASDSVALTLRRAGPDADPVARRPPGNRRARHARHPRPALRVPQRGTLESDRLPEPPRRRLVVWLATSVFADGKFISIFAMLLGASIVMLAGRPATVRLPRGGPTRFG